MHFITVSQIHRIWECDFAGTSIDLFISRHYDILIQQGLVSVASQMSIQTDLFFFVVVVAGGRGTQGDCNGFLSLNMQHSWSVPLATTLET